MLLEICCDNPAAVDAAVQGGAQRVELCAELALDGLTPPDALVRHAVAAGIRTHVLIRPRVGNFVYDAIEAQAMLDDIRRARLLGAHGVVIGALTPQDDINLPLCRRLVEAACGVGEERPLAITFHRAFDVCRQPEQALEDIIRLGCHRLLTSGQAPSARQGIPLLRRLVLQAAGRICIMPGAGVNADNAALILRETGATELHGSFRTDGHTDADAIRRALSASAS